ncbi:WD40-repeat-containing domain protein [Mrakia frigida]|uniref:WD40 repeat domain-containing protein n=1 Tax=Mrakia frigida TaxID=29902 RepID=UPI003FCBF6F8
MFRQPPPPPPPPIGCPDPSTYSLVYTLTGHSAKVSSVKFSPDGTKLASSAADGLVNLWDSKTGKHLRTLVGHTKGVSDIAFSSDSRFIASGSDDNSVRIWSVEFGKPIHSPLLAHKDSILCLSFNPQGNLLASGGKDECVWIWDVRRGKPHLSLPAHSDPVSGVNFNRDGTMLVSCSWDGLIRMWDTSSGQCLKTLVHDDSVPIAHISFTPNGRHVLSTTLDSTARLWDYHTSKCMKTYQGGVLEKWGCPSGFLLHPRRPTSKSKRGTKKDLKGKGREVDMDASKESSNGVEAGLVVENGVGEEEQEVWVVGGSEDGRVLGWEVQSRKIVLDLQASTDPIISVACHPFLPRIATAAVGSDLTVKVWADRGRHVVVPPASSSHASPNGAGGTEVGSDVKKVEVENGVASGSGVLMDGAGEEGGGMEVDEENAT